MADMLVRLYALPDPPAGAPRPRRALTLERTAVTEWVRATFGPGWVEETAAAFVRQPPAVWVDIDRDRLLGFCCYDATARGLLGPIGLAPEARGSGRGRALLLAALADMHAQGYAYAVIGAAGAPEFFTHCAGAVPIEGSEPGLYAGRLKV